MDKLPSFSFLISDDHWKSKRNYSNTYGIRQTVTNGQAIRNNSDRINTIKPPYKKLLIIDCINPKLICRIRLKSET